MFIEVPNIEKIKKKELFDIIKQKLKSKEALYYKINNNVIYIFENQIKSNLLLRKLRKKIYERNEKNFIIISKNQNQEKENDDTTSVIDIFVYMNNKIISNSYKLELGSFLSIIANNKPSESENFNIYYLNDEQINNFIPKVISLTDFKRENFIPVELEFTKDDEKEINKEVSLEEQLKKIKEQLKEYYDKYKEKLLNSYKYNKKMFLIVFLGFFLIINALFGYKYYSDYQKEKEEERLFLEDQERMKQLNIQKQIRRKKAEEERLKQEEEDKKESERKFKEKFLIMLKKNMEIYEFLKLTKEMDIEYVQIKSNNTMDLILKDKKYLKYFDYKDISIMDNKYILYNINLTSTLEKLRDDNKISNHYYDYYNNVEIPEADEKISKVNELKGSLEEVNNNNVYMFQKNINLKDVEMIFKNNKQDLNIYLQNQNDGDIKLFISEDEEIVIKIKREEERKAKGVENKKNNVKKMNIN